MNAVIQLTLTLLAQIAPQLGSANVALIEKIINGLVVLIPILIKEYKDLVPHIKNIIEVLKNSGNLTETQWNTLIELETKVDAEFDQAASNALADDEATDTQ